MVEVEPTLLLTFELPCSNYLVRRALQNSLEKTINNSPTYFTVRRTTLARRESQRNANAPMGIWGTFQFLRTVVFTKTYAIPLHFSVCSESCSFVL